MSFDQEVHDGVRETPQQAAQQRIASHDLMVGKRDVVELRHGGEDEFGNPIWYAVAEDERLVLAFVGTATTQTDALWHLARLLLRDLCRRAGDEMAQAVEEQRRIAAGES